MSVAAGADLCGARALQIDERLAEARARAARTALIVASRPRARSWLGTRLARMLTAIRRSA